MSWLVETTDDGVVPAVEAGKAAVETFATTSPGMGLIFGGIASALAAGGALLKIKNKGNK